MKIKINFWVLDSLFNFKSWETLFIQWLKERDESFIGICFFITDESKDVIRLKGIIDTPLKEKETWCSCFINWIESRNEQMAGTCISI